MVTTCCAASGVAFYYLGRMHGDEVGAPPGTPTDADRLKAYGHRGLRAQEAAALLGPQI